MSVDNEFRIHGNLVREVRRGRAGNGVITAFYVVAVDRQMLTDEGARNATDFIPITTYGKQAESDLKYLAKGKEVIIRGRIRSWYDRSQGRGGFAFEPDPGCVRYIGAPVTTNEATAIEGEHDDWLRDYDAASHRYDAALSMTRQRRMDATCLINHSSGIPQ
jgi:single-strand DNA-binding protein